MRWQALFEDLEAQLDAAQRADEEMEIADRVRREQGSVVLADRLRGQIGMILRVECSGGEFFRGELTLVGSEWVVLECAPAEMIIPLAAVRAIEGLGRGVVLERSHVQGSLGLTSALRSLARDRAFVVVHRVEGGARIEGTIDRVGRDFIEVAAVLQGEFRRSTSVSGVYAVPFSAIAAVSSR